jgi:hypothetical protein
LAILTTSIMAMVSIMGTASIMVMASATTVALATAAAPAITAILRCGTVGPMARLVSSASPHGTVHP